MGRAKKIKVEVNSNDSLQSVMQEVYNNACSQIKDAQTVINEVVAGTTPEDVDDRAKIAKAKTDALKVKDSAIKIKLDLGKLQNEIIKNGGSITKAVSSNPEIIGNSDFEDIRALIDAKNKN